MSALRWLVLASSLLVACGDDGGKKAISDSDADPISAGGTGGSGSAGAASTAGTSGAAGQQTGAPGDPPPANSIVGTVLDPAMSWKGYTAGSDELGVVTLSEYFDPKGDKGIRALLITEGQSDCGPCIAEATDIHENLQGKWGQLGIKVMQLVVSDINGQTATTSTAYAWKKRIAASWAVAADPEFTFAEVGSNPYPIQIIVDPRTLTITHRLEGYRKELPELEALAEKNQLAHRQRGSPSTTQSKRSE